MKAFKFQIAGKFRNHPVIVAMSDASKLAESEEMLRDDFRDCTVTLIGEVPFLGELDADYMI